MTRNNPTYPWSFVKAEDQRETRVCGLPQCKKIITEYWQSELSGFVQCDSCFRQNEPKLAKSVDNRRK